VAEPRRKSGGKTDTRGPKKAAAKSKSKRKAKLSSKSRVGVADRCEAERLVIQRRTEQLRAMVGIAETMLRHTSLDDLLSAITRELYRIIRFDRTSVALLDPDGHSLVLSHIHTADGVIHDPAEGRRIPLDESTLVGWVATHRKPMRRCEVAGDDRFDEVVREAKLQSDIVVPLISRGRLIGTLNAGSVTEDAFTEEDLENLVSCANLVCGAIEHALLLKDARDIGDRYQKLRQHGSDIFMLIEKNTGRLTEVNRKCCDTLRYTDAELLTKTFFDLFPQEDQYQARRDFINVLSEKTRSFIDRRMIKKDGEIIFVDINANMITIKDDTFIQVVMNDVSQRKMLEQQIIMQNKNLQDANKSLREVDQMKMEFLDNISHELRTPLSIIIAYSEALREENIEPEDRANFLDVIVENGQDLLQLIDDLLDLSDLEMSGAMVNTSLSHVHDVVRSVWRRVERLAADKRIRIDFEPGEDVPVIHIDNRRITQVLMCLLHNAIKFTGERGSITVRTKLGQGGVLVEVEDTGTGIAPDQLPKIFDAFKQLDGSSTRKWGGLGIGLAMAKHIVELHGGRIRVESDEGRGSVFTFVLPVDLDDDFLKRDNRNKSLDPYKTTF
jgi:PAS domain S-box-containing protein